MQEDWRQLFPSNLLFMGVRAFHRSSCLPSVRSNDDPSSWRGHGHGGVRHPVHVLRSILLVRPDGRMDGRGRFLSALPLLMVKTNGRMGGKWALVDDRALPVVVFSLQMNVIRDAPLCQRCIIRPSGWETHTTASLPIDRRIIDEDDAAATWRMTRTHSFTQSAVLSPESPPWNLK